MEAVPRGGEVAALAEIEPAIPRAYIPGLGVVAALIHRTICDVEPAPLPWRALLHRAVELRNDLPDGLHSMVLTIMPRMAAELEAHDVEAAQQIIARGLFGRSDVQDNALNAMDIIEAETEFTFPREDSVWARLVAIGRPLAEADIRAVDMLIDHPVDQSDLLAPLPKAANDPVTADWVRTSRYGNAVKRLESVPHGSEVATLTEIESGISEAYIPGLELVARLILRVIDDAEPAHLAWHPLLHRAVELRSHLHDELRSMVLAIIASAASGLNAADIEPAQQFIARGLFGRPDIQYDALAALEAIAAEPEFTVPVGESVWARLIAIGKPLAEADIRALDILLGRSADGT